MNIIIPRVTNQLTIGHIKLTVEKVLECLQSSIKATLFLCFIGYVSLMKITRG
jgi:hypothetical protein